MKKILFAILAAATALTARAQQVTVQHKAYETCYDQSLHEPVWVKWTLTPSMLPKDHLPRTNNFTEDPQIPGTKLNRDYEKSGYDQGHQMPAEDAASDRQEESECFYFSNMEPQRPELNRVTWKGLEMWCRHEVTSTGHTLTIVCGGWQFVGTIGPDKVAIPAFCWKAVQENGAWCAWLMPNDASVKTKPFTAYEVPISALDAKLGFKVEVLR